MLQGSSSISKVFALVQANSSLNFAEDESIGDGVHQRGRLALLLGLSVGSSVSFSPSRDALQDSWFLGSDSLESFLKLFPNSGDSEEQGRSSPVQGLNQRALQSIRPSEVDLTSLNNWTENIQSESCNVGQRQVRHNSVVRSLELRPVTVGNMEEALSLPDHVVVTDHASLGVSSSATGVDEACYTSRLLLVHEGCDRRVSHFSARRHEVSPEDEALISSAISGDGAFSPDNNFLNLGHFV